MAASVITRPNKQWQADQRAFADRSLDDRDYVYVWADGIHFNMAGVGRMAKAIIAAIRATG